MATVIFADEEITIEVPDGTRLQEAVDQAGADIPFGCREGECATCIIEVLEGMEYLGEPNENELLTLMEDELERGVRLTCQCRVSGGTVKIREAEDTF
jgi:ferredoxin